MNAKELYLYQEERNRIWNLITKEIGRRERCITRVVHFILLKYGDSFGSLQLKKRNLGAGVYEIWMEKESK